MTLDNDSCGCGKAYGIENIMRKFYLLLLLALVCLNCSGTNSEVQKFSGTLEMTEYSVGPAVAGKIAKVFIEEEQHVKAGQTIAEMEHYQMFKRDYDRSDALIKTGDVSQEQYEHDRQNMEDQIVVSPVDGVILVKVRESGEVVLQGSPIAVIGKTNDIWVKVYVPEGIVNKLKINQQAKIRLDGLSREYTGHIIFIASKAEFTPRNVQTEEERISQTFAVKVRVNDMDGSLRPGVAADVYFNLKED